MNSKTKIVVIRQKHLIAGLAVFLAVLLLFIFALFGMFSGRDESAQNAQSAAYRAGVYTASLTLNGSPMNIRLTVDENNINDIELLNVSEAVTTMYPLIETSFEDIRTQVMENGSTQGLHFSNENTYSASALADAIELALSKARIKPDTP